jgi:hypothetical protein
MSELCPKISPWKENAANVPISPAFFIGTGLARIKKM